MPPSCFYLLGFLPRANLAKSSYPYAYEKHSLSVVLYKSIHRLVGRLICVFHLAVEVASKIRRVAFNPDQFLSHVARVTPHHLSRINLTCPKPSQPSEVFWPIFFIFLHLACFAMAAR